MPVDAARSSRPELLALLALDPSLSGIELGGALFLDTETTGLGGAGAIAFLLGLAWFDEQARLNVEQLLLRSPADEPALLTLLSERLARTTLLVSYNGKAFRLAAAEEPLRHEPPTNSWQFAASGPAPRGAAAAPRAARRLRAHYPRE